MFSSAGTAWVLAFGLMILNTDMYNRNIKASGGDCSHGGVVVVVVVVVVVMMYIRDTKASRGGASRGGRGGSALPCIC